jgi:hypothetical protein
LINELCDHTQTANQKLLSTVRVGSEEQGTIFECKSTYPNMLLQRINSHKMNACEGNQSHNINFLSGLEKSNE